MNSFLFFYLIFACFLVFLHQKCGDGLSSSLQNGLLWMKI